MMPPIEEMKLTHIGIDCLEKIFIYLPLHDLLNVADSNKQLKEAADLVFRLKHGNKELDIVSFHSPKRRFLEFIRSNASLNLKITLQLLRCFGYLLHKLKINLKQNSFTRNFNSWDVCIGHLIFYMKLYCVEILTEFYTLDAQSKLLNHFEMPFPNVHTAFVRSSELPNMSLNELFPKLKRLIYGVSCMGDLAIIESDVQALDHLKIKLESGAHEIIDSNLFRTVRLNPMLQSLAVPLHTIYQGMNEFLPHLTHLRVDIYGTPEIPNSTEFHFDTVKRVKIQYHLCGFRKLPLSFNNLDELVIKDASQSRNMLDNHEEFYNFIAKHTSITKLNICGRRVRVDLLKIVNMLPLLREFDVCGKFSIHDVNRVNKHTKTLKKMVIILYKDRYNLPFGTCNSDLATLRMLLSKDWHVARQDHRHLLNRN